MNFQTLKNMVTDREGLEDILEKINELTIKGKRDDEVELDYKKIGLIKVKKRKIVPGPLINILGFYDEIKSSNILVIKCMDVQSVKSIINILNYYNINHIKEGSYVFSESFDLNDARINIWRFSFEKIGLMLKENLEEAIIESVNYSDLTQTEFCRLTVNNEKTVYENFKTIMDNFLKSKIKAKSLNYSLD